MLSESELKVWLHRELSSQDKLLLILATFNAPCQIADLARVAAAAGFKMPKTWNPSSMLGRSRGLAIRVPNGWEITEAGKLRLQNLGVSKVSPAAQKVAVDLRKLAERIKDKTVRAFVDEAIKCHELELRRSAVVMSWLAAVGVLHKYVVENVLAEFNAEAKRVDPKWKDAKTADDIGRMKESDFLDRLVGLSLLGKNVKAELSECLTRRNGCGHPNSLKIGDNTVAHHLEILMLNVFEPFQ